MNQHDPNAHFVRRPEPRVLRRAMDCAHMRAALSAALGEKVDEVLIARTFFSAARPIAIVYKVRRAGEAEHASLIGEVTGEETAVHFQSERRKLRRERCAQLRRDDETSLFTLADPGIVVRRPGFDSKLGGLKLLHDEALAAEFLAQLFDMPRAGSLAHVELKAQRLGKRAVLFAKLRNWRTGTRQAYIRLRPTTYEAGSGAHALHRRVAENMCGAQVVRLPEALGFDPELGAAAYSALSGRAPRLSGGSAEDDARLCGAALKELRERGPADGPVWTAEDEIEGLEQWRGLIRAFRPELAQGFETALGGVAQALRTAAAGAPAACHRDFHEGQILVSGASCGLLDFDTLCLADPALDIGNFCAHARFSELRGEGATGGFEARFIEAAGSGIANIGVWRRAALLRLGAIYSFSSEPAHIAAALMAEAGA